MRSWPMLMQRGSLGGERRGEEHRARTSEEPATVYHWVPP
jgi:hypothetical protein